MTLPIWQNAGHEHDGLARPKRWERDHGSVVAAEGKEDFIVQPFHDRLLLPQQLNARPTLVLLAARNHLSHHRLAIGG